MSQTVRTQGFNIHHKDVAYVAFLVVLEPVAVTYELKFNRCTYTKEIIYATFVTAAENAAKSHHTPTNHTG